MLAEIIKLATLEQKSIEDQPEMSRTGYVKKGVTNERREDRSEEILGEQPKILPMTPQPIQEPTPEAKYSAVLATYAGGGEDTGCEVFSIPVALWVPSFWQF